MILPSPERRLWAAVLRRAVDDCVLYARGRRVLDWQRVTQAWPWVQSEDCAVVCGAINVCHHRVVAVTLERMEGEI